MDSLSAGLSIFLLWYFVAVAYCDSQVKLFVGVSQESLQACRNTTCTVPGVKFSAACARPCSTSLPSLSGQLPQFSSYNNISYCTQGYRPKLLTADGSQVLKKGVTWIDTFYLDEALLFGKLACDSRRECLELYTPSRMECWTPYGTVAQVYNLTYGPKFISLYRKEIDAPKSITRGRNVTLGCPEAYTVPYSADLRYFWTISQNNSNNYTNLLTVIGRQYNFSSSELPVGVLLLTCHVHSIHTPSRQSSFSYIVTVSEAPAKYHHSFAFYVWFPCLSVTLLSLSGVFTISQRNRTARGRPRPLGRRSSQAPASTFLYKALCCGGRHREAEVLHYGSVTLLPLAKKRPAVKERSFFRPILTAVFEKIQLRRSFSDPRTLIANQELQGLPTEPMIGRPACQTLEIPPAEVILVPASLQEEFQQPFTNLNLQIPSYSNKTFFDVMEIMHNQHFNQEGDKDAVDSQSFVGRALKDTSPRVQLTSDDVAALTGSIATAYGKLNHDMRTLESMRQLESVLAGVCDASAYNAIDSALSQIFLTVAGSATYAAEQRGHRDEASSEQPAKKEADNSKA